MGIETGQRSVKRMRNRGGTLQGTSLRNLPPGWRFHTSVLKSQRSNSTKQGNSSAPAPCSDSCVLRDILWWKTALVVAVEGEAHDFGEGSGRRGGRPHCCVYRQGVAKLQLCQQLAKPRGCSEAELVAFSLILGSQIG